MPSRLTQDISALAWRAFVLQNQMKKFLSMSLVFGIIASVTSNDRTKTAAHELGLIYPRLFQLLEGEKLDCLGYCRDFVSCCYRNYEKKINEKTFAGRRQKKKVVVAQICFHAPILFRRL